MPQNAVTDADEELPSRGAQRDPTGRHFFVMGWCREAGRGQGFDRRASAQSL